MRPSLQRPPVHPATSAASDALPRPIGGGSDLSADGGGGIRGHQQPPINRIQPGPHFPEAASSQHESADKSVLPPLSQSGAAAAAGAQGQAAAAPVPDDANYALLER